MKNTSYYLIEGYLLGKEEENEEGTKYFLWQDGQWVPDEKSVIFGYFMGFDPTESEDSPYAVGNLSIMDEIEEITEEQAKEIMENHTMTIT